MAPWCDFACGCCCIGMLILQCFSSGLQRCNSTIDGVSSSSSITVASRALLDFKAGLTSASSGGSVLPSWINGSNPCNASQRWEGVTCDDDASGREVVAALQLGYRALSGAISPTALARLCEAGLTVLDLSSNSLSGSIPAEALGACRSLHHLDLRGNHLSGFLGPSLFSNLSALRHLDLSGNYLSGSLAPSLFSNLSALLHLDLSNNKFSGFLPPSIWHLPALQTLILITPGYEADQPMRLAPDIPEDLPFCANITQIQVVGVSLISTKGNLMTSISKCAKKLQIFTLQNTNLAVGSVPDDFWQLPSLTYLYLESPGAVRASSLPASVASCENLEVLRLINISLAGATLPPSLGKCKKLRHLFLSQTGVQGVIPLSIWDLPALQTVVLEEPNLIFEASLPPQLPSCGTIEVIHIEGVKLGGHIPPSLGNCSSLRDLTLSGVGMRGSIPETLGNLSQLATLDVSNNTLNGEVPAAALLTCTSLEEVRLHQNSLTGALDQLELWKMTNLFIFTAQENRFHGRVTSNLTRSSGLKLVDLGSNNLSGELPSEKESQGLQSLMVLILSDNRLGGEIPTWMWELPNLQMLGLSHCWLAGVIPTSIAHLSYFKRNDPMNDTKTLDTDYNNAHLDILVQEDEHQIFLAYLSSNRISLDLSHNSINGPIPHSLGELVGLTILDLSHNSLSGTIPPSLGNLAQLDVLDLSSNSLEGNIPFQLGHLSFLGTLNLSNNHLVGPIPTTNNFNTRFDASSFQGNPRLCGSPLPNPCTKNTTTTTNNISNSNDTTSSSWFDDNMSIGGLVLGYILGLLGTLCLLWWRNIKGGWFKQLHLF